MLPSSANLKIKKAKILIRKNICFFPTRKMFLFFDKNPFKNGQSTGWQAQRVEDTQRKTLEEGIEKKWQKTTIAKSYTSISNCATRFQIVDHLGCWGTAPAAGRTGHSAIGRLGVALVGRTPPRQTDRDRRWAMSTFPPKGIGLCGLSFGIRYHAW